MEGKNHGQNFSQYEIIHSNNARSITTQTHCSVDATVQPPNVSRLNPGDMKVATINNTFIGLSLLRY